MRLLEGVRGTLQSDGHGAYDEVARVLSLVHCGCIAHARRKFFEAIQALPKSERKSHTAAHEGVQRIDALYAIEREAKDMSDAERQSIRGQKSRPLLESLHAWASDLKQHTMASGTLGDALHYLLAQWPKLIRYVDDGRVAIDTNVAENAIRPFALGRRNWLFCDTVNGAKASANLQPSTDVPRQRDRTLRVSAALISSVAGRTNRQRHRGAAALEKQHPISHGRLT